MCRSFPPLDNPSMSNFHLILRRVLTLYTSPEPEDQCLMLPSLMYVGQEPVQMPMHRVRWKRYPAECSDYVQLIISVYPIHIYIQEFKTLVNRTIHALLIIRKLEIPQIPLNSRIPSLILTTPRIRLPHFQILPLHIMRKNMVHTRVRLHPQLPYNPDPILVRRLILFDLVGAHHCNTSRVTPRPAVEEIVIEDAPVRTHGMVVDGGFPGRDHVVG